MIYSRRNLLILTGSLCGLGLAIASRQTQASLGLKAPPRGDVRIVVISDLNSQYGSTTYESEVTQAIALIPNLKPDLVLCGGDMIAGQKKSLTKKQINDMWKAFDHHIAAPLRKAKIPFGFTIGNHDGSGSLSQGKYIFQAERDLAAIYWKNPTHDPKLNFIDRSGFPFYYTFTQNKIFYLVWDASSHIISENQIAWVKKSLGSRDAQRAKMRIAIGHLPLYGISIGRDKVGEFLDNAEQLRSLLEKYKVHTYISGHDHAYYPGKRGQLELLHAGALGSGPRQLLNSNLPPTKTLTVVDIHLGKQETIYTTYDLKTLSVINIQSLPRFIMAPNGKIFRRDLQAES
ncbi:metallophosphoesterase [Aphanothece hegewaldii CCALA 016]|uniref:Metallophosphoesterase n=1 Tax=Aphanothece hegewaldii CCALA 016 TaxID=2107694 RepID=A0A2T1M267_9CHRO|nr:metallophosphoesterase [Aphanothece hegewaldii]PSF38851.1 metallophosphoesterase [Aphanothece hegewaldii CCALA 016]